MKNIGPLAAAIMVAACQPPADRQPAGSSSPADEPPASIEPLRVDWQPLTYPATRECGIVRSADWSARLVTAPGKPARLNVTGSVSTKPTTRLSLRLDPLVRESFPVQRSIFLDAAAPAEPTPDIAEGRVLRGDWAIEGRPGVVSIHCGRTVLATIRDHAPLP